MNDVHLKFSGAFSYVSLELGALRSINPHVGMDATAYADISFDRGQLSMSCATLKEIARRAQEALIAAEAKQHRRSV